jgi:hypothetical protein
LPENINFAENIEISRPWFTDHTAQPFADVDKDHPPGAGIRGGHSTSKTKHHQKSQAHYYFLQYIYRKNEK